MTRPVRPEDFVKYRTISAPAFSPDGSRIAVSVHQASLEDDAYTSDIVVMSAEGKGTTRFTYGGKDSDPAWSPDGRRLLFLSKRTVAKEEKGNELYMMSAEGGEARRLLKRKEGIESPEWSPDGASVYFVSAVVEEEKDKDDVKVVRRIGLWFNGIGYVYNARKHAFNFRIDTGEVKQLTSGEPQVTAVHPSHDGKRVAYLASTDDLQPFVIDLFVLDLKSRRTTKLTGSDMAISDFAWSPDDRSIAFNANRFPHGFASNSHIWLVRASGGPLRQLERVDRNKGNTVNTDARSKAHGPNGVIWVRSYIYYFQQDGGSAHFYRIRRGGKAELVVGGTRSVEGADVAGSKVAFVAMDASHLEEVYVKAGSERALTSLNSGVYDELEIAQPKSFEFRASDGESIEGWVLSPKKVKRKVPTILYVHGGPKTAFGASYLHEFQAFVGHGYAVLFTNPRGSDGYSEEFADIRGDYGNRDFKDLLESIDAAAKRFPFIDAKRMAIAGGSYGGFMTNWAVGHTNKFKAAVTDRSIASWVSMFGTSDIGPHFTKDQIGSDPWKDEEKLLEQSPLRYVKNVKTPVLVVHSMEDYRCPWMEGIQFYTALKYMRKKAEMVVFPSENHDLSRTGKPKHRVARLNHYIRWFDTYLK